MELNFQSLLELQKERKMTRLKRVKDGGVQDFLFFRCYFKLVDKVRKGSQSDFMFPQNILREF